LIPRAQLCRQAAREDVMTSTSNLLGLLDRKQFEALTAAPRYA